MRSRGSEISARRLQKQLKVTDTEIEETRASEEHLLVMIDKLQSTLIKYEKEAVAGNVLVYTVCLNWQEDAPNSTTVLEISTQSCFQSVVLTVFVQSLQAEYFRTERRLVEVD